MLHPLLTGLGHGGSVREIVVVRGEGGGGQGQALEDRLLPGVLLVPPDLPLSRHAVLVGEPPGQEGCHLSWV